ncbi:YtxH domain-containing protein [Planomonospora corallina]|uniref:YtxH domain-containing protein n=1 Tax=Planomonospora corallina TaxID=1806052 RepID=A0ABV8I692_9ACTN
MGRVRLSTPVEVEMYRMMFCAGLAVGYVLGSRAGRERYEQIRRMAQRVTDNPSVQEAAGLVGAQVTKVKSMAKEQVANRLPHRGEEHDGSGTGWPEEEARTVSSPATTATTTTAATSSTSPTSPY